jgi:hypothetical protein
MKTKTYIALTFLAASLLQAATTIDHAHPYGYGANIGWINAEADTTNGAVIGQAFCSGYLYSANCGWISLGNGTPANGQAYGNASATDFGINHDGHGNLTGYAYGANIGWITFEQTYGQPRVDLMTGELSGYAWGANVGWIALSGIKTLTMAEGPDTDGDGIPDAWEYARAGDLTTLGGGDADGDGATDQGEYLADTNPQDSAEYLRITDFQTMGTTNQVTWPVETTRLYTLEQATVLSNGMSWTAATPSFIPASGPDVTETLSAVTNATRFYRVKATPPLQ